MRKLLNTVYVTNENAYLSLENDNLVCRIDGETKLRIPFANVEAIVCFGYLGCSPALMGKCVEEQVVLSFVSPQGRFLAKVSGETRGNVFLRVAQIDVIREKSVALARNTIAAKLANCISVLRRSRHDIPALREDEEVTAAIDYLKDGISKVCETDSLETVLGIEGNCAKMYFGFFHQLRSGRSSLACDLVEETRCHAERFTLTMFNLGMLTDADFEFKPTGAVWLNDDGRKKVLTKWQEKKRSDIEHPYLKQKIQFGLLPYVQSNLFAKFIRGELDEYPCYINR